MSRIPRPQSTKKQNRKSVSENQAKTSTCVNEPQDHFGETMEDFFSESNTLKLTDIFDEEKKRLPPSFSHTEEDLGDFPSVCEEELYRMFHLDALEHPLSDCDEEYGM